MKPVTKKTKKKTSKTTAHSTKPAAKPAVAPKKRANDPGVLKTTAHPAFAAAAKAAETSGKATSRPSRDAKLPAIRRHEARARKLLTRFETLQRKLAPWGGADAATGVALGVSNLLATLDGVIDEGKALMLAFKKIPDDFAPPRGKPGARALDIGTVVCITDKAKPAYEGIVEAEQMLDLTVVVVANGKVKVKAKDGETLVLPRGHIAPQKAA